MRSSWLISTTTRTSMEVAEPPYGIVEHSLRTRSRPPRGSAAAGGKGRGGIRVGGKPAAGPAARGRGRPFPRPCRPCGAGLRRRRPPPTSRLRAAPPPAAADIAPPRCAAAGRRRRRRHAGVGCRRGLVACCANGGALPAGATGRGQSGTYSNVKKSLQKVSGVMTIPRINFRNKFITFVTASTILLQKLFDDTICRIIPP